MKKKLTILILIIITLASCKKGTSLALNEGTIQNDVHENSIGKIAFMSDWIPFEEFNENDFKKKLSIYHSSNFGFRMFLGKTLTYYLSQLEPNLPVQDLCNKGNFQLTFYVDNNEIYKYNLQTGAGSCDYKNSATIYGIPLVDENNSDHWGRFLWMKFLRKAGGRKALSNGQHLLKLEVRPYIQNENLKVGNIIAQGEIMLTIKEENVDESKIAIQQIEPIDNWEIFENCYDTLLIKQLNEKIAQNYFKDITSIVVIKDGKLLIEEYFNGANRNTLHDTRSVGKSFTSTLIGIAIEDGFLESTDQKLKYFYDLTKYSNYSSEKDNVTLKSLLAMSSGFDGSDDNSDSPGNEDNIQGTNNWVKSTLDLPMDDSKKNGEKWDYFTAGVMVLGDILEKSVPEGLEKYADKKLFTPLGISTYKWFYTPQKVPYTGGGLKMNSLDNARYGQLYLDDGSYNGRQILSTKWVKSSLSNQIAIPNTENEYYGYLFWNKKYKVEGSEYEAYYASGNGGNKIMIFKNLGVVIVITTTAYGQPYMHLQSDEMVGEYILPSIINGINDY